MIIRPDNTQPLILSHPELFKDLLVCHAKVPGLAIVQLKVDNQSAINMMTEEENQKKTKRATTICRLLLGFPVHHSFDFFKYLWDKNEQQGASVLAHGLFHDVIKRVAPKE